MKTNKILKIVISIIVITLAIILLNCNEVKANDEENYEVADIHVLDSDGIDLKYMPPCSGGPGSILNTNLNYDNCIYSLYVDNYYGDTIETEFGTFIFKEKKSHISYNNDVYYSYYYTANVNPNDIINKNGEYHLIFTATNQETGEVDTFLAWFYFYKESYTTNSYLKMNDTYCIKDGKYTTKCFFGSDKYFENTGSFFKNNDVNDECLAIYYEFENTLYICSSNFNGTIEYANMGESFTIDTERFGLRRM